MIASRNWLTGNCQLEVGGCEDGHNRAAYQRPESTFCRVRERPSFSADPLIYPPMCVNSLVFSDFDDGDFHGNYGTGS